MTVHIAVDCTLAFGAADLSGHLPLDAAVREAPCQPHRVERNAAGRRPYRTRTSGPTTSLPYRTR